MIVFLEFDINSQMSFQQGFTTELKKCFYWYVQGVCLCKNFHRAFHRAFDFLFFYWWMQFDSALEKKRFIFKPLLSKKNFPNQISMHVLVSFYVRYQAATFLFHLLCSSKGIVGFTQLVGGKVRLLCSP